ncbi:hypothetical protein PUV54_04605 [Hyphococcus flavus]|uniref:Uncharacterized protein n=1 Tax=Hyphococcus flavus TaxID=1866326 RepID=A0AAF0CGK3_9PROT|nr:M10 family metallopeptidase C-terminal domain-containing protein [Hyphococcus flavus]WDI32474.1 hypothetical protein PUV54_04605 [Hyphococcus flavus]
MTTIPGDHTSTVRINIGDQFTGLTSPGNQFFDLDAIGIDLEAGTTYRVSLSPYDHSTQSDFDTKIVDILDGSGNSLGLSDDDSGAGLASVLLFTPSSNDTYFIVAGPNSPGDLGGLYTLQVTEFTAPVDDFSTALDPSDPISIWETQDAHIGASGDTDTIAISLEAGVEVDITVYGNDIGFYGELGDAEFVSFVDDSGVAVDAGLLETAEALGTFTASGPFSAHQISFTPTETGVYYITVGSEGDNLGDYSVSVSAHDRGVYSIRASEDFVLTGNPEIDMFFTFSGPTDADPIFSDRDGDGFTTLTYSIPGANPGTSPGQQYAIASEWTYGYAPASGVVLDGFLSVIAQVGSFSNINFVEVPDTGVQAGAFRIGDTDIELGSASGALVTGWSGFPGWTTAGETWINVDKGLENVEAIRNFGVSNISSSNFLFNRTLHEFTHNLGLLHPDFSPLASSVDPTMLGQEYSVMSRAGFTAIPGVTAFGDVSPQTLMWFDIQALQAAYGVNTTETAGDDMFALNTNDQHFRTIWDYAGNDTLELSGSSDVVIDLTPGTWQDVGTSISYYSLTDGSFAGTNKNTVFIAPDTLIENVESGRGDDEIRGNDAANVISSGEGEDAVNGQAGDDVISGKQGDDLLVGSTGNDTIDGGAGLDVIYGGDGEDVLSGGSSRDVLAAGVKNDILDGEGGNDELYGGANNDLLIGGDGNDTMFGAKGVDTVQGGDGNDIVSGAADNDFLDGGEGDDLLFGGVQNDRITGGSGNDTFLYNAGNDIDLITDFAAGMGTEDVIELNNFGTDFDTFAEVMAAATDDGTDTTINFGNGDLIILQNVLATNLHEDDFAFG